MKPTSLLPFLLLLAACTDPKQDQIKKLSGEVIALHDEVMPKTEELMTLKAQIQERMGKDSKASPLGRRLVAALDSADNAMSDWMADFDPDASKKPADEAIKYFENEKAEIEAVKKQTDETIAAARAFVSSYSQQ
jgi:aminoglycoside phosphotransferase